MTLSLYSLIHTKSIFDGVHIERTLIRGRSKAKTLLRCPTAATQLNFDLLGGFKKEAHIVFGRAN